MNSAINASRPSNRQRTANVVVTGRCQPADIEHGASADGRGLLDLQPGRGADPWHLRRAVAGQSQQHHNTAEFHDQPQHRYRRAHVCGKVFLGRQFNRYLDMELGCFDVGKFGWQATTTPAGTLTGDVRAQSATVRNTPSQTRWAAVAT